MGDTGRIDILWTTTMQYKPIQWIHVKSFHLEEYKLQCLIQAFGFV